MGKGAHEISRLALKIRQPGEQQGVSVPAGGVLPLIFCAAQGKQVSKARPSLEPRSQIPLNFRVWRSMLPFPGSKPAPVSFWLQVGSHSPQEANSHGSSHPPAGLSPDSRSLIALVNLKPHTVRVALEHHPSTGFWGPSLPWGSHPDCLESPTKSLLDDAQYQTSQGPHPGRCREQATPVGLHSGVGSHCLSRTGPFVHGRALGDLPHPSPHQLQVLSIPHPHARARHSKKSVSKPTEYK